MPLSFEQYAVSSDPGSAPAGTARTYFDGSRVWISVHGNDYQPLVDELIRANTPGHVPGESAEFMQSNGQYVTLAPSMSFRISIEVTATVVISGVHSIVSFAGTYDALADASDVIVWASVSEQLTDASNTGVEIALDTSQTARLCLKVNTGATQAQVTCQGELSFVNAKNL